MVGPEGLLARLGRADPVSLALGVAYLTGGAGLALAVVRGTRGVALTLALLAATFVCLCYASLTILGRHA